MTAGRVPRSTCVVCGERLDGQAPTDSESQAVPTAGDCSICVYCGTISTFEADGTLRRPTADEMKSFVADPEIRAIVRTIALRIGIGRQ